MFGVITSVLRLHSKKILCQHFNSCNVFKYYLKNAKLFKPTHHILNLPKFNNWKMSSLNISRNIHTYGHNFNNSSQIPMQYNYLKSNIKVNNNVMLYKFEKPWLFKLIIACAVAISIGCLTMANNVYLVLCKDLFNKDMSLKTRLKQHILPLGMILVGIVAGPVILYLFWILSVRSIKYLILHKGSKKVTIVTYHPLKSEVKLTVPVDNITCIVSRSDKKSYVNFKIKDHKHHYFLDKSGNFVNPELFDIVLDRHRF